MRSLVLALVLALAFPVVAPPPAAANVGYPPPVRTPSGQPIVGDRLTEWRSYHWWHLTLVDPIYRLFWFYEPRDLVPVTSAGIPGRGMVRALVIDDLRAMDRAARAAGIRLRVVSAYRSYAQQEATFAYWVRRSGWNQAIRYSARPGHSEHQLGTVVDLSFVGGLDPWEYRDFGATRAGAWLQANAWRYGFVMSYPRGMERETGYGYEPWHFRYFGRALAAEHRVSGLSPRMWLWRRN